VHLHHRVGANHRERYRLAQLLDLGPILYVRFLCLEPILRSRFTTPAL
jgi:hypothetical protein